MPISPEPTIELRALQQRRPTGRPSMYQSWQELLFLHWRCDPAVIQRLLPAELTVDTCDGQAWIGVVPFLMRHIRPWWAPAVPWISNFLELNLRTYVCDQRGTPGVWFFSLDCNQPLAVWWARKFFGLPYHQAQMSASRRRETPALHEFACLRRGVRPELASRFRFEPQGGAASAVQGTLESFLVERYVLFALHHGQLHSGRVHHAPYQIQQVRLETYDDRLLQLGGLPVTGAPCDHACYVAGVDVEVFPIEPVTA